MPTGIQIDSVLTLDTSKAERQLKEIAKGVKPVSLPINFSSEAIEQKVAELKKVTFDWAVTPDIEFDAISQLKEIVGEIQANSQFKIIPDVGFVEINQLKQDIEDIRSRSTIDVIADVNFAEVERLKRDLSELKAQSELRLRLASDSANLTSTQENNRKTAEELVSTAKEQTKKLENVIDEQRNTQKTIKAESAVSIANFLKGKIASAAFGGLKKAVVSEFNIDENAIEKAIARILPSTRIIAEDIKDFSSRLSEFSGTKASTEKLISSLLTGFADATAGANSLEEIGTRLKKTAKESFSTFSTELEQSRAKLSNLESVLKALGLSSDRYLMTLLKTKTVASSARGISRSLDKPLAERKERIQTKRLGSVLERAEELINQPVRQSAKKAKNLASNYKNVLGAVDDSLQELILVIGGFADTSNSGILRAIEINKQLEEVNKLGKSAAVGIKNPDIFKGNLPRNIASAAAIARPNIRGFSRDAEELAAQAIAALIKNPELKIKLVGESGGGFAAEEAIQILNKLGFGERVQGAGFGTPSFKAKASRPQNFTPYLGVNREETLGYEVRNFYANLGFVDPSVTRKNPKVSQSLKGLEGHTLENYFELAEFRSFVLGEEGGRKQVRASAQKIAEIRKEAIELAIKGAAAEVIRGLEEFEKYTRITGVAEAPFNKLKQDVQAFQTDIESGIVNQLQQYSKAIANVSSQFDEAEYGGDVDFFKNIKADIAQIKIVIQKLGLNASEITQQIINDVNQNLVALLTAIPNYESPELLKAGFIRRRAEEILNTVPDLDLDQATSTINEIEATLTDFLSAVKELGEVTGKTEVKKGLETQLKRIQKLKNPSPPSPQTNQVTIREREGEATIAKSEIPPVLSSEIENISSEIQSQAFDIELPTIESIDVSKETLKDAIAEYKDTIIAYRKKLEQKILKGTVTDAELEAGTELIKRGQALSRELKERGGYAREARNLSGVTDTLSRKIASVEVRSTEAIGKDVVKGILKGTNEKLAMVFAQGQALGIELLEGFKKQLEIKSPSGKFRDEMSEVAAGIVEGRIKERARIRQAGEDIGKDLFDGSQLSLAQYKELLFNLESLIQQKKQLQAQTYQQAFELPDSDISQELEQIRELEQAIEKTAEEIAAFIEVSQQPIDINLDEFIENIPDDIELEIDTEVVRDELDEFIDNIPDDIELEIEADTGDSDRELSRLDKNLDQIRRTARTALQALIGFGTLQITSSLSTYFEDIIRQSIETQIQFEQLETSINFVAGSAEAGAKALEFVGETARKLKIDLQVATNGYKQLAAAAKNTELETETNRIFNSIAQASRVFGLSAEQTEGAILAISQIISKGTVQAEELRGQLGERIPGAFQIAARAMNVTTQELGKLLETGQVTSEEFLPKFVRQLESETKGGVTGAINTTGAALQELRTAYTQLQLEIAKTTKPAQLALYITLADGLRLASENLNILIPAAKILTATLITLFLPAITSLGSLLKNIIISNFGKLLTLLNANNASLGTMAKTAKIAGAAFGTFVAIEAISQAISLIQNVRNFSREAKDAVKDLDATYQEFLKNLSNNNPNNPLIQEDIVQANIEKAQKEVGRVAKFIDGFKKILAQENLAKTPEEREKRTGGRRLLLGKTYAEAAVDLAEAKALEAIAKANANLLNIPISIGTQVKEVETGDIQNAIDTINRNIANLKAVAPTTIETLNSQSEAIQRQNAKLKEYNDELKRRNGLEKTLATVELQRRTTVDEATRIEVAAFNQINKEILDSGELKRDVELEKLNITNTRIEAELKAEKQALQDMESIIKKRSLNKADTEIAELQKQFDNGAISAEDLANRIKEVNDRLIGIDSDSGFLKGLSEKEIETFRKIRDRIIELEQSAVESRINIATEEVESKIRIYDKYLEKIEDKRQEAEDLAISSEKERLIEIQQLVNDDVITTERAEELKFALTRDRITDRLYEEKEKLRQLEKFKTDEVAAREKADNDIKTSRQKVLDLTLQLLEQEKQAEERTIAAIATARDNVFSALERRLSNLQQLYSTQAQLDSERATADERLADLELSKLRQALSIRQQLNSADLDRYERQTLIRQLASLGVKGRTDELSLLSKIEDREKRLAELKLQNLEKQQKAQQATLEIEIQQLEIATKKAKIEAEREQRTAQQELVAAERAIATAATPEELETANELYDLALAGLDIANLEVTAAKKQLDNLDAIIAKKRENLLLTQAIAIAEQEGTTVDEQFEREKARNQALENRDRRRAETLTGKERERLLNQYLSTQEQINSKIEAQKTKVETAGGEFTAQDEAKLRAKYTRQSNQIENRQESNVRRSLLGSPGFTIEAPPEILEAIRNGKPFTVPVVPQVKSSVPLEVETLGKKKGTLDQENMILETLKDIKQNFKQPTVINVTNDNQFVNQYQRNNEDELLRKTRSDLLEIVSSAVNELD